MIRKARLYNKVIEQERFKPGNALAAATKTETLEGM